jgi:hypothetical protein
MRPSSLHLHFTADVPVILFAHIHIPTHPHAHANAYLLQNPALDLYRQATPEAAAELQQGAEITGAMREIEPERVKETSLPSSGPCCDSPAKAFIHVEGEMLAEESADDTKHYDVADVPNMSSEPVTPAPAADQAVAGEVPTEVVESALDTPAAPASNLAEKLDAAKISPKLTTKDAAERKATKGLASHPIKSPPSNSTKTGPSSRPGSASKNISLRTNSAKKTPQKALMSSAAVSPGPNAARPTAASVAKREAGPHVSSSPVWKY